MDGSGMALLLDMILARGAMREDSHLPGVFNNPLPEGTGANSPGTCSRRNTPGTEIPKFVHLRSEIYFRKSEAHTRTNLCR
jgi:hypothetical protein